jgi:hypothetical protein
LDDCLRFRLRIFEIYSDEPDCKIGQCAVAVSAKRTFFVDGIQLRPGYEAYWGPVMTALLAKLGPGRYRYGSQWSIEPARDRSLKNINGVTVEEVEPLIVQAIDFSRWKSWDDYFGQVSRNARQNARRACRQYPKLSVKVHRGLPTLLDTPIVTGLQFLTAMRKNTKASLAIILARFLFRSIALRQYTMTAVASNGGRPLAAVSGVEFGHNTYYLTGGSQPKNGGAAWHLLLAVIREAYNRTLGCGKFLMGPVRKYERGWDNLARSREQCRITEFPTSIVTFSYRCSADNSHRADLRRTLRPVIGLLVVVAMF